MENYLNANVKRIKNEMNEIGDYLKANVERKKKERND